MSLHRTLTKLFDQFVDDVVAAVRTAAAEGMQAAEAAVAGLVDAFVKSVDASASAPRRRVKSVPRRVSTNGPLPAAASSRGRRRQKKPARGPRASQRKAEGRRPVDLQPIRMEGEITDPAALLGATGEATPARLPSEPKTGRRTTTEMPSTPLVRLREGETLLRSSGGGIVLRRTKATG